MKRCGGSYGEWGLWKDTLRNQGASFRDSFAMKGVRSLMKSTACCPTHAVGCSDSFAYAYLPDHGNRWACQITTTTSHTSDIVQVSDEVPHGAVNDLGREVPLFYNPYLAIYQLCTPPF